MRNFFSRLGLVGASIVVAALVFGVLAGGVIVHRLEASPASSQQHDQQGESSDQQDETQSKPSHGHSKTPHSPEPSDSPEND